MIFRDRLLNLGQPGTHQPSSSRVPSHTSSTRSALQLEVSTAQLWPIQHAGGSWEKSMVGSTFGVEAMAPGQVRNWQEEAEEEGTAVWEVGRPGRGLSRRVDIDTRLSIVAMPRRKKVSVTKEVWEMFDQN